jgi:DNA-directed RNA polymerase subunit alpha
VLQKNWIELIKPSKMDVNVQENDGRIGRLIAEPLERGFGLTLGNAIRRV